ncbi:MAG: hypothetical protein V4527_13920 [Pseudomonadota bacterium]
MRSSHARHEIEYEAAVTPAPLVAGDVKRFPGAVQTVMDPRVYKIALACWVSLLGIFWITFWVSTNALFMVVISTGYAIVFFGVPYLMSRQIIDHPVPARSLLAFMRAPFATIDGTMRGWEALLQVILVPLCLIGGGIAISFIIYAARAAH